MITVSTSGSSSMRRSSIWSSVFLALATTMFLTGCGSIIKPPKMVERRSEIPGNSIKTIAVIAGDDMQTTIRMSAGVREQLTKGGWNAIRKSGRWASEVEALEEICKPGTETVDGVLVVTYNILNLRHCESKSTAYRIEGGGELGLPQMAERLMVYLRTGTQ
jgi:hypothetical protein